MKIHAIRTGTVWVKESQRVGRGHGLMRQVNILLDRVSRARLAGDPPDVLIAPRIAPIGLIEFHRAAETIELGARATREALPHIQYAMEKLE